MKTFPAFHALTARKVVIAGDGEAAARKARLAVAAGASPVFIASGVDPALAAEFGHVGEFDAREPSPASFAGAALAFIAVDDEAESARLADYARAVSVPVNVVDRPAQSDFIVPSIVDRGDVVAAVSTAGAAPVLGRRIREKIEALLPSRLGMLAEFARSQRGAVAERIAPDARRAFWERFFDGPIAAQVLEGNEEDASRKIVEELNRQTADKKIGVVHLVGAGPGDPDLLTLKALRLLQDADVILYDRLVSADILSLARRDAKKLFVGKAKSEHAVPQREIERTLISLAREGKNVVRLKGGDPFIFGRGGEELEAVEAAGIPVYVTPGVTAAIGCSAASKIPLTHREYSQAVTFVTGHAQGDKEPDLDWRALAALGHTLVVYMGVGKADVITRNLIFNGRSGSTPVAVIEKGTLKDERVFTGRLAELGAIIRAAEIKGPAVLIIGEVAAKAKASSLRDLATFEKSAA